MKTLLVDADSLVYAAACVSETRTYAVHNNGVFLGPFTTKKDALAILATHPEASIYTHLHVADFDAAWYRLNNSLDRIRHHAKQRYGKINELVYISGTGNFRERLSAKFPYKGNRINVDKPQHLHRLREALVNAGAVKIHHMEPDDEVAIRLSEDTANCVAVSIDKDIKQVPGTHLIPDKGFMTVSPRSGLLRLYAQIIGGDATDGVPGAHGYSPEGAAKLLLPSVAAADTLHETARKFWRVTLSCYQTSIARRGLKWDGHEDAEQAAIETARFVYLLRERPKDAAKIPLWEPPL